MCGFAGFLDRRRTLTNPERVLRKMGATLARRGPDDEGSFFDTTHGVGLSHRRLSVLDLSASGHQPMVSRSGRVVCAYNGEIYNFRELRSRLESTGSVFRGKSDTEVLVEAIERWGITEATRAFNGMFAFALLDRSTRQFWLVRDRLGIKPLYYGRVGESWLFASELKALLEYPGFSAEIDPNAAALFLRHGYVPGPFSIYRNVFKVEPGTLLEFATDRWEEPTELRYWTALDSLASDPRAPDSPEAVAEELEPLIRDAVRARLVSDVPIGTFLSGGIDSPLVTALAKESAGDRLKTFTMGFDDPAMNESSAAATIAAHLGTEHTLFHTNDQTALDLVTELGTVYDEPFADSSAIPTLLLSRLTREHVTVCLSGDGGDELFFGYHNHHRGLEAWNSLDRVPVAARELLARASRPLARAAGLLSELRLPGQGERLANFAATQHHLQTGATLLAAPQAPDFYRDLVSIWKDPLPIHSTSTEREPWLTRVVLREAAPRVADFMPIADLLGYLPDDILTKVDRASMHCSLEVRVPLLDHRVVEKALALPLSARFDGRRGKLPLRRLLARRLPDHLLARPKQGFEVPLGPWLRGPLRRWADDLFEERAPAGLEFLDGDVARKTWRDFLRAPRMSPFRAWNLLMLLQWKRAQPA